jgi:hypothetical protein
MGSNEEIVFRVVSGMVFGITAFIVIFGIKYLRPQEKNSRMETRKKVIVG